MKKKMTITLGGLHCANCAKTIEKAMKNVDGAESAIVNLGAKKATVTYDDSKSSPKKIVESIERAGYEAKLEEER